MATGKKALVEKEGNIPTSASLDDKLSDAVEDLGGDEVIEGSEGVTQHEFDTLRHVADKLPIGSWLVVIAEFAERWAYYGTTAILGNYIRAPLPRGSTTGAVVFDEDRAGGIPGALNRGVKVAFAIGTFNSFLAFITPFIGAILADTKWGRYKTLTIFSYFCLAGHIMLVGGSSPGALANPSVALGLLIASILVIAVGTGSIKANVSPMVAEQYQGKLRKKVLPSGETVVVSPSLTIQSVFLYFYASINLGASGSISASFLARDHGYWIAWLVPTGIFLLVPLVLTLGKRFYVVTKPRGSILLETFRVIRIALAPAWSFNPVKMINRIRRDDFWEIAKPSYYQVGDAPRHITWDDQFVGEVARTVSACGVFLFFPFFYLCYSQLGLLSVTAAGMTLNGTPNDLIGNLNPIAIIILVPTFDKVIYPTLRRYKIDFTPIKRIYAGFLVAGLAMVYAAVLQSYVIKTSPCHDGEPAACVTELGTPNPSHINVWAVAGPYLLAAVAEIMAVVTTLEYAFTKAPERMRSVVMAFSQFPIALAAAVSFAFTDITIEPNFTWLYGSFAIVSWVAGTIFYLIFRNLDKKEHELNAIGRGERPGFVDEQPAATVTEKAQ